MATNYFIRVAFYGVAVTWLAGCAQLPDWALFAAPATEPTPASVAGYRFNWRLSGDRRVGAVQVFDDGRSTWLQFMPDQPLPAIFARTVRGDHVLLARRHGDYAVVEGVWSVLILRSGSLESRVERVVSDESAIPAAAPTPSDETSDVEALLEPQHSGMSASSSPEAAAPAPSLGSAALLSTGARSTEPLALPEDYAKHGSITEPLDGESSVSAYGVSPQDGNLRLALARWANLSGWTFGPEHWTVDVDIPIVGSAIFESEFSAAVQELLASTELSERPLQPCFYANRVLRVVAYAQSCDRSMVRERA